MRFGIVIPNSLDLTIEQKDLMLRLNGFVKELCELDDEVLRPSEELNGAEYANLYMIARTPEVNVGYILTEQPDASVYNCETWLNLHFYLEICAGTHPYTDDGFRWLHNSLTPKQTFWICKKLQDNALLVSHIQGVALANVVAIKKAADEIQRQVEKNELFDEDKWNKIFDTEPTDLWTNEQIRAQYRYRKEESQKHREMLLSSRSKILKGEEK